MFVLHPFPMTVLALTGASPVAIHSNCPPSCAKGMLSIGLDEPAGNLTHFKGEKSCRFLLVAQLARYIHPLKFNNSLPLKQPWFCWKTKCLTSFPFGMAGNIFQGRTVCSTSRKPWIYEPEISKFRHQWNWQLQEKRAVSSSVPGKSQKGQTTPSSCLNDRGCFGSTGNWSTPPKMNEGTLKRDYPPGYPYISHLWKRKIIFKLCFGEGYVSSQEDIYVYIYIYFSLYFSREYIIQPLIFRGHVSFQWSN